MPEGGELPVAASLTCRKIHVGGMGTVYAWETADGDTGNILITPDGSAARPCTPEGTSLGDTVLRKDTGNVEHAALNPKLRRTFLLTASLIFQEQERQGHPPDRITRTYW